MRTVPFRSGLCHMFTLGRSVPAHAISTPPPWTQRGDRQPSNTALATTTRAVPTENRSLLECRSTEFTEPLNTVFN